LYFGFNHSNHVTLQSYFLQHLSVEEEEWETRHLQNPKRLGETRRVNFINEQNADINR
jgi:hypothetical protein